MIGNDEGSYEFIMKISFDNSTLSGDAELSAALPFMTYGADRFLLRRTTPHVAVTGVSLDQSSLSMNVSDTEQLTATVSPNDATDKTVTWESSNTGVCTVVDGLIAALGTGSATVTVETVDGNFTDTCSVSVS
jgi:transglutaminase/protease-like cytokinesis protein 3